MNIVQPRPGEGWAKLITTPKFNGGDEIQPDWHDQIDNHLNSVPGLGLLRDGTPSVLFTLQSAAPGEVLVHWCNDGRTPLKDSLDLLDGIVRSQPGVKHLAFVRRPALVRLLASRGWWLQSHEDEPFMALMVCQHETTQTAQ